MSTIKISPDLYDTVLEMEHIEEVHFTKDNQHYFNIHELLEEKSKRGTGKFYGSLKMENKKTGEDGSGKPIFKSVAVANPAAFIVATLSRDEILAMDTTPAEEIFGKQNVMAKKRTAAKSAKASA